MFARALNISWIIEIITAAFEPCWEVSSTHKFTLGNSNIAWEPSFYRAPLGTDIWAVTCNLRCLQDIDVWRDIGSFAASYWTTRLLALGTCLFCSRYSDWKRRKNCFIVIGLNLQLCFLVPCSYTYNPYNRRLVWVCSLDWELNLFPSLHARRIMVRKRMKENYCPISFYPRGIYDTGYSYVYRWVVYLYQENKRYLGNR
jgi:hypothetical protein